MEFLLTAWQIVDEFKRRKGLVQSLEEEITALEMQQGLLQTVKLEGHRDSKALVQSLEEEVSADMQQGLLQNVKEEVRGQS